MKSKKIQYGYNGEHSGKCPYTGNEALAYARLEVVDNTLVYISAVEAGYFDELLKSANNNDMGISIDTETAERFPYSIIYGGMFFADKVTDNYDKDTHKMLSDFENDVNGCDDDGYEILSIDENYKNMVAGSMHRLYIIKESKYRKGSNFYPFAALIQTDKNINSMPGPTTFFFYESQYQNLWENMINRPLLFAARKKIQITDSQMSKEEVEDIISRWQSLIVLSELIEAFQVADLVDVDENELQRELNEE